MKRRANTLNKKLILSENELAYMFLKSELVFRYIIYFLK